MQRLLPSLAIILVVSMTPGVLELIENAGHLIGHGDTAHSSAGHDDDGTEDEHGCTGASHACSCHATPHFAPAPPPARLASNTLNGQDGFFSATLAFDSGFAAGIDRPPKA